MLILYEGAGSSNSIEIKKVFNFEKNDKKRWDQINKLLDIFYE